MIEEKQLNLIARKINESLSKPLSDVKGRQLLTEIFDELYAASKQELFTGEDEFGDFGLKLCSSSAAGCMPDYYRTVKYWQALLNNVNRRNDNSVIRVLYPGCGPFATLVLPILALRLSAPIELVLLDVSETSLENAKHLWQSLNKPNLEVTFVQSDVLKYHDHLPYDIVIFECLTKALEAEAQVAITLHVSKLLKDTGRLIPHSIECHLVGTSLKGEVEQLLKLTDKTDAAITGMLMPFRRHKVALLKLDQHTYKVAQIESDNILLGQFDLTVFAAKRDLVITTILRLDDAITIEEYQCGLTFPTDVDWQSEGRGIVNVNYCLRPVPKFYIADETGVNQS